MQSLRPNVYPEEYSQMSDYAWKKYNVYFTDAMDDYWLNYMWFCLLIKELGPGFQSIVSLTRLLVIKILTVLLSTITNSQVFLLKKMWVAFANAKATHIFSSKNISIYAIFNDQSFNDTLTNHIVSFQQPAMATYFNMVCIMGNIRGQQRPRSAYASAVWSGPSLSTNRIVGYYRICERRAKAQIVLCTSAGWFESVHFAHTRRHFRFARPIS